MHKLFRRIAVILVAFVMILGLPMTQSVNAETPDPVITIAHTNDIHGNLQKSDDYTVIPKLATYINDIVQPDFLVDGGDAFQGLPISNLSKGTHLAEIMLLMGYDLYSVGNHEFDFGLDVLLGNVPGFGKVLKDGGATFTAANITYGDPAVPMFNGSKTLSHTDYNVVGIGIATPETYTKTHPNNIVGVNFTDPLAAVKREVDANPTADLFIISAHLGNDLTTKPEDTSVYLAEQLSIFYEDTDYKFAIIDGHSHTVFTERQYVYGDNVILAQTGTALNNLGVIEVNMNDWSLTVNKLVPSSVFAAADVVANESIQAFVDDAKAEFASFSSEIVLAGNTVLLNGARADARTRETNLGNLVADAVYAYAQDAFPGHTDFAFFNGGGIRTNITEGDINVGHIIAVLPFGNLVARIEVSGENVIKLFEHSLRSALEAGATDVNGFAKLGQNGGFAQVSEHVRVHYDPLLPINSRVTLVEIKDKAGTYQPVDPSATYFVATNDFLGAGGDGYTMLGGPQLQGESADEALKAYIKEIGVAGLEAKYGTDGTLNRVISESIYDLAELNLLLTELIDIDLSLYTSDSKTPFILALEKAEQLISDIETDSYGVITQDEVDKAHSDLLAAYEALVTFEAADVTKLKEATAAVDKLDPKVYTTTSFKKVSDAYEIGIDILEAYEVDPSSVTQDEVDAAVKAINDAVAALTKVLPDTGQTILPNGLGFVATGGGLLLIEELRRRRQK